MASSYHCRGILNLQWDYLSWPTGLSTEVGFLSARSLTARLKTWSGLTIFRISAMLVRSRWLPCTPRQSLALPQVLFRGFYCAAVLLARPSPQNVEMQVAWSPYENSTLNLRASALGTPSVPFHHQVLCHASEGSIGSNDFG